MDVLLRVVQGKPQGHCLRFAAGEFVFGRGPECHIRPNSEWVSRQHCLLLVDDGGAHLRDLGSTNGTLVNGSLLEGQLTLHDGDILQLGQLVLEVVLPNSPDYQTLHETTFCNKETMTGDH
jgi:pSer/pThr/pTyr-binding forkhead associated (FHA) protein